MYIKIVLTSIAVVLAIIAIELARPSRPDDASALPPPSAGELQLARKIPELKLKGVTRKEAIEILRQETRANLVVDWTSIVDPAIQQQRVNIELHDISLAGVVRVLFPDVEYNVRDGVISISDRFSPSEMSIRIYCVQDLLSDEYWGIATPPDIAPSVHTSRLEAIAKTVTETVSPNVWTTSGNQSPGTASVTVAGGNLVVLQSTGGHRAVARFLAQLRRAGRWRNGTTGEMSCTFD